MPRTTTSRRTQREPDTIDSLIALPTPNGVHEIPESSGRTLARANDPNHAQALERGRTLTRGPLRLRT